MNDSDVGMAMALACLALSLVLMVGILALVKLNDQKKQLIQIQETLQNLDASGR